MSRTTLEPVQGREGAYFGGAAVYVFARNGSMDRADSVDGTDSAEVAAFVAAETLVTGYLTEAGLNEVSYPLTTNSEGRCPDAWYPPGAYDVYMPADAVNPIQRWEANSVPSEEVTLDDDFSRIDGPLGVDPRSGYLWAPSGSGLPNIASGALVNSVANSTGYAITRMDTKPVELGGTFSLHPGGGTDAASCTAIAASGSADLQNLVHPDFTQSGWVVQKRIAGSWTVLDSGTFDTPLAHDGTIYTYGWRLDGEKITVTWPDGTISEVTDADLATLHSAICFWEIVEQANSPLVKWRTAYAREAA